MLPWGEEKCMTRELLFSLSGSRFRGPRTRKEALPACSGAPAIRNAIYNATGVALHKLPMNPHNLFAAFTEAGLIHDEWQEG